jgi:hypothetical protein
VTLKNMGCKLVNYNPDHPFVFSGIGSGNKNVTNSFNLFNYHITYNLTLQKTIERDYQIPTLFLPFGFELNENLYDEISKIDEINRVCFIGNPDETRIEFITYLLNNNVDLTLIGHDWKSKIGNYSNCEIIEAAYHHEFWYNLRKYRIQLNIFRKHNAGSHNMRTFEIPAIGGIQLAPDTIEHRMFFEVESEIFLYLEKEDCLDKIQQIQKMKAIEINDFRNASRKKSLNSNYSYLERSKTVFNFFSTII